MNPCLVGDSFPAMAFSLTQLVVLHRWGIFAWCLFFHMHVTCSMKYTSVELEMGPSSFTHPRYASKQTKVNKTEQRQTQSTQKSRFCGILGSIEAPWHFSKDFEFCGVLCVCARCTLHSMYDRRRDRASFTAGKSGFLLLFGLLFCRCTHGLCQVNNISFSP